MTPPLTPAEVAGRLMPENKYADCSGATCVVQKRYFVKSRLTSARK